MKERKIGQQRLAEVTQLSQSTISRLLNGEREATISDLLVLAAFFEVSPTAFYDIAVFNADFFRMHQAKHWTVAECAEALQLPPEEVEGYLTGTRQVSVGVLRVMKMLCNDSAEFPGLKLAQLADPPANLVPVRLKTMTLAELIEADEHNDVFFRPKTQTKTQIGTRADLPEGGSRITRKPMNYGAHGPTASALNEKGRAGVSSKRDAAVAEDSMAEAEEVASPSPESRTKPGAGAPSVHKRKPGGGAGKGS